MFLSEVSPTVEKIVKKKEREAIINVEKYLYIDWVLWNGRWTPVFRSFIWGWIFEDLKTAKETAKTFKAFFRVKEDWRRIDNRELPVVFVDFEEWITFYCVRGHQLHPLDAIALRYLKKSTNIEKAFKQLARDLAEFFKECGGEVEWGVEDG